MEALLSRVRLEFDRERMLGFDLFAEHFRDMKFSLIFSGRQVGAVNWGFGAHEGCMIWKTSERSSGSQWHVLTRFEVRRRRRMGRYASWEHFVNYDI